MEIDGAWGVQDLILACVVSIGLICMYLNIFRCHDYAFKPLDVSQALHFTTLDVITQDFHAFPHAPE